MLIISRHKEDIEWSNDIENVVVYNVGSNEIEHSTPFIINTKYDHIYSLFHYICNNYDKLDKYIIFVKLDNKRYEEITHNKINKIKGYINNQNNLNIDFEYFSEYYNIMNMKKPFNEEDEKSTLVDIYSNQLLRSNEYYNDFFNKLFDPIEDITLKRSDILSFIISKDNIYKRTKEFYLNILKMLSYIEYPYTTREGIIIEILIEKIFTNKFTNFIPNIESSYIELEEKREDNIIVKENIFIPQCEICRIEYEKHNFHTVFCSIECHNKYLKTLC